MGFFNYKSFFSINLFVLIDENYKFISVEIGNEGSASDGEILMRSPIYKLIQDWDCFLPPDDYLLQSKEFPYVFIGNDAFLLKSHLMKPYPGKYSNQEDKIFNYPLSRAGFFRDSSCKVENLPYYHCC